MQQEMTEEQAKELQEKLKNMNPEELREFQKQQCIFCKIISGEVQSKKIYDDEKSIAILDINPANPGHSLLMPKEHYALMPLIPPEELGHLAMVTKGLSNAMLSKMGAEGTTIFIANGVAAGQRAQHFMIHIIPRKEGDGIGIEIPTGNKPTNETKEKIKAGIEKVMGKQTIQLEKKEPEKKEEQVEKPTEKSEPIKETKYITSEKAKRYHKKTCAFAQNIREEKRIYETAEEMEKKGKKPCTCITGKKMLTNAQKLKISDTIKGTEKKKAIKPTKEQPEEEGGASLDDIANLFK